MATEHVLTDADTIHGLAVKYNTDWQRIVEYNGLEYPYTLTNIQAYKSLYAGGYVKVSRELFTSALVIYKGSTFTTELDGQGIQKVYEVVEDTTIPAGSAHGYVYVRCTIYGTFGNCIAGAISRLGQVSTSLGQYVSITSVVNEHPITSGADAKVLTTGQVIFIPSVEDPSEGTIVNDATVFLNTLGGTDLAIAEDGDLTDNGYGDLGGVIGIDNIIQSCKVRLMTRRGSITQHPHFGSGLHHLIGRAQAPYIRKLMELDIYETLADDDRINGVQVNSVDIRGTTVYVNITIKVANVSENFRHSLNFGSMA